MNYISTRGFDNTGVSSAMAIKKGLAEDGGLYMPESIPEIDLDYIRSLSSLSYPERAAKVLSLFLTDYTEEELLEDARGAYAEDKFIPSAAPITALDGGRFLFLIIEAIIRRPINKNVESYINFIGIMILFAFMIFITFKDVLKLIIG